jgi:hypothetical protein
MALQITLPDRYGNGGTKYWKIIETNINWLNSTAHVVMAGWVSEQARLDGKEPLDSIAYDFTADNFPFVISELDKEGVNTLTVAYEAIKAPKIATEEVAPIKEGDPVTTKEVDQNVFSSAVDI